jgi:hypothetical protein
MRAVPAGADGHGAARRDLPLVRAVGSLVRAVSVGIGRLGDGRANGAGAANRRRPGACALPLSHIRASCPALPCTIRLPGAPGRVTATRALVHLRQFCHAAAADGRLAHSAVSGLRAILRREGRLPAATT